MSWFTEGAWDVADRSLIYYGGDNFAGTNLATTMGFSGGAWSAISTTGSNPGPLDGPALAYDVTDRTVVMYGGLQSYSPFSYTNITYTYTAGVWNATHLDPTPPPRLAGTMAWDSDLGGVVLFGGYNNSDPSGSTLLNDLWLYKAGAWSKLPDGTPPSTRTWPSLAFDPGRHELVLYGGVTASLSCLGDTWTYSNGSWTHVLVPSGGPASLLGTELGYDPDLSQVILTGGQSCTGVNNTRAWAFNGSAWNAVAAPGSSGTHIYGVAAWDPVDRMYVVSGGNSSATSTDVLSPPLAVNISGPSSGEVGQTVSFTANATGGVPVRTFSWNWGDGSSPGAGTSAGHAYASTGTFPLEVTVAAGSAPAAHWFGNVTISPSIVPTISQTSQQTDVGSDVTFTAASVGGSGGASYAWLFGDGTSAVGSPVVHNYSAAGNYTITLTARDSVGGQGSARSTVWAVPRLTASLGAFGSVEVGVSVEWGVSISGGVAPVSVVWTLDDGGTSTASTLRHVFTTAGAHSLSLNVTDAAGVSVLDFRTFTAVPAVAVAVTGPSALPPGGSGTWTANVTGGATPYTVTWTASDGESGNGTSASLSPGSAGSFSVRFNVTDALGGSATAQRNFTVASGSTPLGGSVAGIPTLALAGVVGAVVAVGAAVWAIRRRHPA